MTYADVMPMKGGKSDLRRRDGPVPLLTGGVPDLRLDGLPLHLDAACGKLHPDRALALQVELVSGEAGQKVALAHTRIPNQHHCRGRPQHSVIISCREWTTNTLACTSAQVDVPMQQKYDFLLL